MIPVAPIVRALVCHGPGQISWDPVPVPAIEEPNDAIVRVDATTVCGSDLRILRGDLPDVKPGTVLGHEAVGEVLEVGRDVHHVRPGDQVVMSTVSACGRCRECRDTKLGQCSGAAVDSGQSDQRDTGRAGADSLRRHSTHRRPDAYEAFAYGATTGALKVVLHRE